MRNENPATKLAVATKSDLLQEYRVLRGEIMQHEAVPDDLPLVGRESVALPANELARHLEFTKARAYVCQKSLLIVGASSHKMRVQRSMRYQGTNNRCPHPQDRAAHIEFLSDQRRSSRQPSFRESDHQFGPSWQQKTAIIGPCGPDVMNADTSLHLHPWQAARNFAHEFEAVILG
jgi:hypothetical protein